MEIWKDIPNYEGIYQVSDLGRIKSFRKNKVKILKQHKDSKGYLKVRLYDKNLKDKTIVVHVLVAMAFLNHIPTKTHKFVIDHINNNKVDNKVLNLQIITNRENSSKDSKGSSSFVGVFWNKLKNKWQTSIYFKNRNIYLGLFDTEIEANNKYKSALSLINSGIDINILYPKRITIKK